jgi:6-phosphogluconolactonase
MHVLIKCMAKFASFVPVIAFLAVSAAGRVAAADELVFFGTLGTGAGKGFSVGHFDTETGVLTKPTLAIPADSPSSFVISRDGKYLYSTNHTSGNVSAFALDAKTGALQLLNTVPSGAGSSYVSLDQTGRYLLAANGNGGSVAVFALKADGSIGERTGLDQHTGHGPNAARQATPYAHCIIADPTNHFLLSADLGTDHVYVYKFDATNGKITPTDPAFVSVQPGFGPRHLVFHPNGKIVYLLNEMGSAIVAFSWDSSKGALAQIQSITTLPADFTAANNAAEIVVRPDGKFLYATNRGRDSIAVFSIDPATFRLTHLQDIATQGQTPRVLSLDPTGQWIIAGNEDSGTAMVFRVNVQTGLLTPVAAPIPVPAPSCAVFLSVRAMDK